MDKVHVNLDEDVIRVEEMRSVGWGDQAVGLYPSLKELLQGAKLRRKHIYELERLGGWLLRESKLPSKCIP
jgi:hypothetical protein